jgi:hypothetical protein
MYYQMSFDTHLRNQAFIATVRLDHQIINTAQIVKRRQFPVMPTITGEFAQVGILRDLNFAPYDMLICNEVATTALVKMVGLHRDIVGSLRKVDFFLTYQA